MDSVRAAAALSFLEDNGAAVAVHPGAAFAEREILRAVLNADASGPAGLVGAAYLADLQRGVMVVEDRSQAYRFTHAVLFSSDFGRQPIEGVDLSGYGVLIEALVQQYLQDADVLGELLMSAKCLGYWSGAMDAALATFTAAWDALDRENFAESYHPLLVGGLLFSME